MNIEILKNKKGHWQDMIALSPNRKAWRKDLHTGFIYIIDECGSCIRSKFPDDIGEEAKDNEWRGLLDWSPVIPNILKE